MRTLIFIVLKIAEIAAIPLIYLGLCYSGYYAFNFLDSFLGESSAPMLKTGVDFYLGCPLIMLFALLTTFFICILIYHLITSIPDWIDKNREWSNSIYNRLFH